MCPEGFRGCTLQSLNAEWTVLAHQTGIAIANRVLMRTAASVIIAASSSFERATSPTEAVLTVLEETTTSVALGARVVLVTLGRWLNGRWW